MLSDRLGVLTNLIKLVNLFVERIEVVGLSVCCRGTPVKSNDNCRADGSAPCTLPLRGAGRKRGQGSVDPGITLRVTRIVSTCSDASRPPVPIDRGHRAPIASYLDLVEGLSARIRRA